MSGIGHNLPQCDTNGEASQSSFGNFIGIFFENVFNGCWDYVNMTPGKITLTISQC